MRRPDRHRPILGITGPPGAGKSTLAAQLVDRLGEQACRLVGMDGFHLADEVLLRAGSLDRKGAPDTFDRDGYASLLARLRSATRTVYAPRFDRDREDSSAAAIEIGVDVPLIITEGNYLMLWPEIRLLLDEVWFLDPPVEQRRQALIGRHIAFGRSPDAAREWADGPDAANAEQINRGRDTADLVLDWTDTASGNRAGSNDAAR